MTGPREAAAQRLADATDTAAHAQDDALYVLSAYSLGIVPAPTPAQAADVLSYVRALRRALDATAGPAREAFRRPPR